MKDTIITFTKEQVKAITDAFSRGESITIEPPKPVITKWEPKGGGYTIGGTFDTLKVNSSNKYRLSGMEHQTQTQAKQAAKALRSYARQLAWLTENDDGWVADWENCDQLKYYVTQTGKNIYDTAIARQVKDLATVYMSDLNATKLSNLLNDGIVEF